MSKPTPWDHFCSPYDLFYVGTEVECGVCGRIWKLVTEKNGFQHYIMIPPMRYPPYRPPFEHQTQPDREIPPDALERLRRAAKEDKREVE